MSSQQRSTSALGKHRCCKEEAIHRVWFRPRNTATINFSPSLRLKELRAPLLVWEVSAAPSPVSWRCLQCWGGLVLYWTIWAAHVCFQSGAYDVCLLSLYSRKVTDALAWQEGQQDACFLRFTDLAHGAHLLKKNLQNPLHVLIIFPKLLK